MKQIPKELANHPKALFVAELRELLKERGEPQFRADQLFTWWHRAKAVHFSQMTNLAKPLREKLQSEFIEEILTISDVIHSADGSEKFVFRTIDGLNVESVFLPEGVRKTLCVSTQIGCSLACSFCKTGTIGLIRNLSAVEIIEQAYSAERWLEKEKGIKLSNLVFMGMGEPLLNYDNTVRALKLLFDPNGRNFSHRHVTVSTAGIIPALKQIATELPQLKLAVSINAPTHEQRLALMPIEKKYPLSELIPVLKPISRQSRNLLTVEYVLINGVNDSTESAKALAKLLKPLRAKVNLIAYNSTGIEGLGRPAERTIYRFQEILIESGLSVFIRTSKGEDVSAACGMLGGKPQK